MAVKKLQFDAEIRAQFKDLAKVKDKFQDIFDIKGLDSKLVKEAQDAISKVGRGFSQLSNFSLNTENIEKARELTSDLATNYEKAYEAFEALRKSVANFKSEGLQKAESSVGNFLASLTGQKETDTSKKFKQLLTPEDLATIQSQTSQADQLEAAINILRGKGPTAYLKGQLTQAEKALKSYRVEAQANLVAQSNLNRQLNVGQQEFSKERKAIDDTNESLDKNTEEAAKLEAQQRADQLKNTIQSFIGFRVVVEQTRQQLRRLVETYQELDKSLTTIASVSGKTRQEMWGMVSTFNDMAQRLGTTTNNIVEASTLYYQQGRSTEEVLSLVEQTTILATISGLDYAEATDKMTTAVNGFNIAASDSNTVVDTWANLAANAAVSVEELSTAISKVASLAANAGMTLESTSAFLSQMISTTREAPENLGTALKFSA